MENDGLAIIIPAYNESNTIQNVIISVINYADVIVVDDGSTDDTATLAKLVGAKVISKKNEGYDSAISKGFEYASNLNYKYLITLDADGEHDTNNLEEFITQLKLGHDVVVGIRKEKRRISEKIFGYLTFIKYGIFDPLCGLKGYSITIYNELGYFDSYNSIGTELLLYAARKQKQIYQIQLVHNKTRKDSRFGNLINGNFKIIRSLIIYLHTN